MLLALPEDSKHCSRHHNHRTGEAYECSQAYECCKQLNRKSIQSAYNPIPPITRRHFVLRSVTVEKCHNSTIILGPVQSSLHVQMCDNVKIISVCQRLSLLSTTNCTFHVLTPTRPLLFSGNQGVVFAPYHTHYPMLEDHMGQTGLATLPNYWDRPLSLAVDNSDQKVWKLISPREFTTFVVPFEMEGDTTEIPGGLPPAFLKSTVQREQKVQMWQKTVKEAGLTKEQRKQFQALVELKFNEWLKSTGNRHQLDSLVQPSDVSKQVAG
ncbi:TBCC domain-containing 1 [Pelobates cultripes]|uniref:TBCC domain-containing 1 n=1 Tax=Pelobates cultripes TaxID=61616 RepID=A0AAD1SR27_PELCU|nr:TBCC domain-containing 1 [Pelobates cultripes]